MATTLMLISVDGDIVDSAVPPAVEAGVLSEDSSPALPLTLPPRPERPDPLSPAAVGVSAALASVVLLSALLVRQRD